MDAAAAHLLNFSQPFDCTLLDQIVLIAMDGSHPQRSAANEFLIRMKDHPDMWRRADAILEGSQQETTKFFGLQVLTEAINTHWKVIPVDQREGIRSYIVSKIIALSSTEESLKKNHAFLSRLNVVLVNILKQDWPQNWPSFIPEIVGASKTSEALCENNMKLLQLLSEDIFDFSKETMTTNKMKVMKDSLTKEFVQILELCEFVLQYSTKNSLIQSTLKTLQRFLTWIPLGYIFETNLIVGIIGKFLPHPSCRTPTVDCLTEIASLQLTSIPDSYKPKIQSIFMTFIQTLETFMPSSLDLKAFYDSTNSEQDQLFISRLSLFLTNFLKNYLMLFDPMHHSLSVLGSNDANNNIPMEYSELLIEALKYMLRISEIDDEEIFKTCLEFWQFFTKELYHYDFSLKSSINSNTTPSPFFSPIGNANDKMRKTRKYDEILHLLRIVMIDKMAKPEEVIVVEDENGEIVREMTKDTEVIAQYKTMREILIYLAHLNYEDTETIMLDKLDHQLRPNGFTWGGLNTLCWAIGSISGAMGELEEKRFLVSVIKDLLKLCEDQRGKDNKAVVASNIMYIVGQYPRFLRAHWKFLKTVVNKLFEFMHEHHPGVQDMACDTFLKIAQKCKRKFMTIQAEDSQAFILVLIQDLNRHIQDLQFHQVLSFYESVGTMLSDFGPAILLSREELVVTLMGNVNEQWKLKLMEGNQDINALLSMDTMKELQKCLKINIKVCQSAGSIYLHQFSVIFMDLFNLYRLYSETIQQAIQTQGNVAIRLMNYKLMKQIKNEIVLLCIACIESCADLNINANNNNNSNNNTNATGLPSISSFQQAMYGNKVSNTMENNTNVYGDLDLSSSIANTKLLTFTQPMNIYQANFMKLIQTEFLSDYQTSLPIARDANILQYFALIISFYQSHIQSEIIPIIDVLLPKTLEMITTNMMDFPDHRLYFFQLLQAIIHTNFHVLFIHTASSLSNQTLILNSIVWAMKHTERNVSETGLEILYEWLYHLSHANVSPSERTTMVHLPQLDNNINPNQLYELTQQFYQQFVLTLLRDLFEIVTDRLHKSGFKLQITILKHLMHLAPMGKLILPLTLPGMQASSNQVTNPLNNVLVVKDYVGNLFTQAFPNVTKAQITTFLSLVLDVNLDLLTFKQHVRDFLITIKEFAIEDNSDLYAEEREAELRVAQQEQWQYRASVPGLLKPEEIVDDPDL